MKAVVEVTRLTLQWPFKLPSQFCPYIPTE